MSPASARALAPEDAPSIEELTQRVDRLTAISFILNARLAELEALNGVDAAPSVDEDWVSVKDAAYRTGFSPSAVYAWIRTGRVLGRKTGGRVLVASHTLPSAK